MWNLCIPFVVFLMCAWVLLIYGVTLSCSGSFCSLPNWFLCLVLLLGDFPWRSFLLLSNGIFRSGILF